MYEKLGVDIGCDSQNDFSYADQLSGLLNAMDQKNHLPRTILYYLNPKDAAMLSVVLPKNFSCKLKKDVGQ